MKGKKVLVLGNKPYSNFKLNNIIDSFDIIYRCNLAWPGKNNGTKFGKLAMCNHIYENFVKKSVSKEQSIKPYENDYDNAYLSDWYDWFQVNKENFDEVFHQNEQTGNQWNEMLKNYGCPHKFTRTPRTGYSTIFRNLINNNSEIYVSSFSLDDDEIRESIGLKIDKAKSEGSGCHSKSDETNILTWLHNNEKIDASLCMLEDTEEISIKSNNMKFSKFILDLVKKK